MVYFCFTPIKDCAALPRFHVLILGVLVFVGCRSTWMGLWMGLWYGPSAVLTRNSNHEGICWTQDWGAAFPRGRTVLPLLRMGKGGPPSCHENCKGSDGL